MSKDLPRVVAAFFKAHNTGQTNDFDALFTPEAVVHDEGREYRGAAIKDWIDKAVAQYQPQASVWSVARAGSMTVVTATVSGSFPGSPVELRYHFTVNGDKIAALSIHT